MGDRHLVVGIVRSLDSARMMFMLERLEQLIARSRGEYNEMPGLRLSVTDASRMWASRKTSPRQYFERWSMTGF